MRNGDPKLPQPAGVSLSLVLGALLSLGPACNNGGIEWIRFNADGDELVVEVGGESPVAQDEGCADEEYGLSLCDDIVALDGTAAADADIGCICMSSSLRANDVGTATVDPTFGAVGTRHTVRVEVLDAFQDIVQRVTVYTDGQRGDEEIELLQDSADPGSWAVELKSLGEADEVRTDRFEIRLYEPDGTFSGETEGAEE